jgi:hypothetical protein
VHAREQGQVATEALQGGDVDFRLASHKTLLLRKGAETAAIDRAARTNFPGGCANELITNDQIVKNEL